VAVPPGMHFLVSGEELDQSFYGSTISQIRLLMRDLCVGGIDESYP
jgi:hypothetical protein